MDMERFIAERKLTSATDPAKDVTVRIAEPHYDAAADNYQCVYRIVGPEIDIRRAAFGVDSVQALQCALVIIGAEISRIEQTIGKLQFEDGDHGFPDR